MTEAAAIPAVEQKGPPALPIRQACDALGMGYVRITPDGKVGDQNVQARAMFGEPKVQPGASELAQLAQAPEVPNGIADKLHKLTPEKPAATIRHTGADGKTYQVTVTAEYGPKGDLLGYDAKATDITETVQDLVEAAEQAYDTADIVMHDVRAPMTAIEGYAQMLATMPNVTREQAIDWSNAIHRTARSAHELAQEYLDYMRASRETIALQPVDMHEVILNLQMSMRSLQRQKAFDIEFPLKNPSVVARPELVQAVLMNYISNAVKYGPEHPHIQVRMEVIDGGKRIKYTVEDDGVPINADDQKKLFQKFGRLQRKSEGDAKGTGLGLASVKLNIERCGGEVGMVAGEEKGNAFFFILPALEQTHAVASS